jgi:glutathione S-transferase
MITVTGFNWVPDFAKGIVRDLRVRWACEEAGVPYQQRLIDQNEKTSDAYRALQPFCQVPAYEDDEVKLFESGAMVLRIAEKSDALLPKADPARARAIAWMFAALNSVEPSIMFLIMVDIFRAEEPWTKQARPTVEALVKKKLGDVAQHLSGREWLEGDRFSAGDLIMATTLRFLRHTDLVTADPVLGPYLKRCEARPAFQRALEAQLDSFQKAA